MILHQERTFKQIQINFERLSQCCKYLPDLLTIQMCYPHQTSFLRQYVLVIYLQLQLYFVLVLQVTVIKNLAEEEKKDANAFLKQQPFAKPGNICEKFKRFYRWLSWSVSMGIKEQRLLFSSACSDVFGRLKCSRVFPPVWHGTPLLVPLANPFVAFPQQFSDTHLCGNVKFNSSFSRT